MTEFKRFQHILFPVDFSQPCIETAPHVLALAQHFHARITALHVVDFPRARIIGMDPSLLWTADEVEQIRRQRAEELETFIRQLLPGADVRGVVEEGEPTVLITGFAEREGVDLIMMPTRGPGPFRRFLLGSVTAKVLYDSPCPVWTSAHQEEPAPLQSGDRSVLCALNLEPDSSVLLKWAADYAAAVNEPLRVIHVIPAVEEHSDNRGVIAVRDYLYEKAREKWAPILSSAGVDATLMLGGGDIARRVAEAAILERASVIVIARGRLQRPLGGLRTQAYAIIREAPCPVIAV